MKGEKRGKSKIDISVFFFLMLVVVGVALANESIQANLSNDSVLDDFVVEGGVWEVVDELDALENDLSMNFKKFKDKEVIKDIVAVDEFQQLKGFKQIGFAISSKDHGKSGERVSHGNFDKKNMNSSKKNFSNKFSSDYFDIESVHEEIDTGFFNVDEKAIKQTYIINNKKNKKKDVTLNVLYEIDSDFVTWNGTNYSISEEPVYFEAFEVEVEVVPGFNDTTWTGHTLYFGNNYYDFKDVLGMDYIVSVYVLGGKSYIDLEVSGEVEALSELVIDPTIGWTAHVISSFADNAISVFAVDLNSDGYMDVLSASALDDKIAWYENDGNEGFTSHNITTSADGAYSVFAIDLDNDDDIDVLSASLFDDTIAWYENDGNEVFTPHTIMVNADGANSVFAIDLDSDGDIDILSASVWDSRIAWYENNGIGGFTGATISLSALGAHSVFAIDLDNDDDIDVLSANLFGDTITWYENNGNEVFTSHDITTFADSARSVFAIDLDNDDDIDVLSASSGDDTIAWYENDGNEVFTSHDITTSADGANYVFAIDLDNDDDIDVLSASVSDDTIAWYENDGNEVFTSHDITTFADSARSVFAIDVDSDGDIDVLSASALADEISWHESDLLQPVACSGTINTFVEDSNGNSMEGLYTYLNGGSAQTTDVDGFSQYSLSTASCDTSQSVQVKCSDQTTVCGTKSTLLGSINDVDSLSFTCDVCRDDKDIFIDEDELTFENVAGGLQVNVTVHSVGMTENVDVSLVKSCNGVKTQLTTQSVSISPTENKTVSFTDSFDGCQKMDVSVEYFTEEDFSTNNVIQDFFIIEPLKVYLDVDTGLSKVNSKIEDFIGDYAQSVSLSDADLEIYVGKELYKTATVTRNYLEDELITFEGQREGLPYNGLIQRGVTVANPRLYVFGNDIDGTVAAVRRLVDEREIYLNNKTLNDNLADIYLAERDLDAVSVYDYLHTDENDGSYRKNNNEFASIVENVLTAKTFHLDVKRVLTANDETSLRIKHVSSEQSVGYKGLIGNKPVVMAGGLFNDLTMWEDDGDGLAVELAENGKDVWEIEITGGPNTECDDCPDYTYQDLVDYYWPALMAGVQYHTGKISMDYVGFSNGCRVALSSLESYQESGKSNAGTVVTTSANISVDLEGSSSNSVVDTFVGVGCPGAFEGSSKLIEQVGDHPDSVQNLRDDGIFHPNLKEVVKKLTLTGFSSIIFDGENSISLKLWEDYTNLISSSSDSQPGNFNVNRSRIIYGIGGVNGAGDEPDDGVVTAQDSIAIADNINSTNSNDRESYDVSHSGFLLAPGLARNNQIKADIRRFLEDGN